MGADPRRAPDAPTASVGAAAGWRRSFVLLDVETFAEYARRERELLGWYPEPTAIHASLRAAARRELRAWASTRPSTIGRLVPTAEVEQVSP